MTGSVGWRPALLAFVKNQLPVFTSCLQFVPALLPEFLIAGSQLVTDQGARTGH